jgi:hypothetical protein
MHPSIIKENSSIDYADLSKQKKSANLFSLASRLSQETAEAEHGNDPPEACLDEEIGAKSPEHVVCELLGVVVLEKDLS